MAQLHPSPTPAKQSTPVLLLLVAAIMLGAGGAAGGYFYFRHNSAAAAPAPALAELDPFVVNLADPGGQRFLRVTMRLVLRSKDQAAALEEDEVARMRLRSSILELLTMQTAEQLVTPDGKAALKAAIAGRAKSVHGDAEVVDVLFTEFVVQF